MTIWTLLNRFGLWRLLNWSLLHRLDIFLRVLLLIEDLSYRMVVSDIWNLVNNFLAQFNLSDLLILVIDQFNKFISIDAYSEVIHIEASIVFFEMNLVITSS